MFEDILGERANYIKNNGIKPDRLYLNPTRYNEFKREVSNLPLADSQKAELARTIYGMEIWVTPTQSTPIRVVARQCRR